MPQWPYRQIIGLANTPERPSRSLPYQKPAHNAKCQLLPEAGAQRRLEAVSCTPWLDRGRLDTVVFLWLNMGHCLQDLLEIGTLPVLGFSG